MTATTTRPKAPIRIHCPVDGCTYTADNEASIPSHVAMAHKDVPIETVAPKRSARNEEHVPAAPAADPSGPGAATLAEIPLDLVEVGDNVRVDVAELEELTSSIREHGVLQPVKAIAVDGRYRLVWGQRRTLAARAAGLATIPAIVVDEDLAEASPKRSVEQLVENLHRADLNPIDRARAMRDVVDSGVSQADLARKLGIAPSTVANDLRLLGTAPEVQDALQSGKLTAAHVKAIASLPVTDQVEWTRAVEREDLSAHDIEHELAERRRRADWEKEDDARRRKDVEQRKVNALAALEAKSVRKEAVIVVAAGYGSGESSESVVAHVAKAGYAAAASKSTYTGERVKGQCDDACLVWLLSVDTWSSSVRLSQACTTQAHYDAKRKASQAKDSEARKERERLKEVVRVRLVELLADVDPNALRAVLWVGLDWSLNDWVKERKGDRKKPDAWGALTDLEGQALVEEVAKYVARAFDDRYNVRLDWPAIEAVFGPEASS